MFPDASPVAEVGLFTLGGTIAMAAALGSSGAVAPSLTAAQLLAAVPGLGAAGIGIKVFDVVQKPGASLTYADVAGVAAAIEEEVTAGAIGGAVVTQGTDTIEETCWLLDLLHRGDAPVVVTGAMRNPTLAGADGPANILAALRVAADPDCRGLGVVVVFGDAVHAADDVVKSHSTSIAAFVSPNMGPIGHLTEGRVRIWRRPSRPDLAELTDLDPDRLGSIRTAVLPMTLEQDNDVVRTIGEQVDGLVVAGFGVGHVPDSTVEVLAELARRIPVVLTTRTGAGSTAVATYAFPGSESDLLARGLMSGGYLSPYKARILLQVLLAAGTSSERMRSVLRRLGGLGEAGET